MAGINPISGVGSVQGLSGISAITGRAKAPQGGFAGALKGFVNQVDQQQRGATVAIRDLVAGKGDILPVVAEVAKADLSFKLLVGVRNKVIEAYKQTMNMQI